MPKKCIVVGCRSGYNKRKRDDDNNTDGTEFIVKTVFNFPVNADLRNRWIKFVNRDGFEPNDNCGVCIDHFEEKFIKRGKRNTLDHGKQPCPTIHTNTEFVSKPSLIPSSTPVRKPPTNRPYSHPLLDETPVFQNLDKVNNIDDFTESMAPKDFQLRKVNDDQVIFYRLIIDGSTFSTNIESISIDSDLHVKLSHKGSIVPLPDWFRSNNNCRLTYVSMLDNLASHIRNRVTEIKLDILKELNSLSYYKPQGRVTYSNELIRFALMQCYTSRQAYELLLHEFPLPSFSYLKNLTKGGIEPIKGLKLLLQEGKVSSDSALLIDEMYLQKSVQYHSGKLIGKDEKGDFYNGILVFMVVGLKQSVP